MDDYQAFKSTSGSSGGGSSGGGKWDFGCGWVVIIIVVIALISFIADGTSWVVIDRLLGFGFLAFLFAKNLFR